jgi:hypothetical protein
MSELTFDLVEGKQVTKYAQVQLKKIKKNKKQINSKEILSKLANEIKDVYSICHQSQEEIIISF